MRTESITLDESARLHTALARALRSDGGSPEAVIALMGRVADEKTWQRLSHRRGRHSTPFQSFTEYVSSAVSHGGLGLPRSDVMALLQVRTELERRPGVSDRDRELAAYREAIRTALANEIPVAEPRGRPPAGKDNATIFNPMSATGILARLKRDDPDLAAAVVRGDLTANAAARQKGWRSPRIELRNPVTVAARIREHFSAEEIEKLIKALRK